MNGVLALFTKCLIDRTLLIIHIYKPTKIGTQYNNIYLLRFSKITFINTLYNS